MTQTLLKPTDLFAPPPLGCVLDLSGKPQGGTTLWDGSPYGNHGSIIGATWTRLPSGLWCLSYDGTDDYVDCGNGGSLDFTSEDFTIEAWVEPDNMGGTYAVFSKYQAGVAGYYFWLRPWGGYTEFVTAQTGAGVVQSTYGKTGDFSGSWGHVVAVRQGADVAMYYNGKDVTHTPSVHSDPDSCSVNAYVGLRAGYDFLGLIALVRVHNRALSALEIQNRYNETKHLFME